MQFQPNKAFRRRRAIRTLSQIFPAKNLPGVNERMESERQNNRTELTNLSVASAARPQKSTQKNTRKLANATHRQTTSLKLFPTTFCYSFCLRYLRFLMRLMQIAPVQNTEFRRLPASKAGFALLSRFLNYDIISATFAISRSSTPSTTANSHSHHSAIFRTSGVVVLLARARSG